MEYIITFKNTNFAIKAEQFLLEEKLHVSVAPLPSQIRAGCGICLRLGPGEIKSAISTLAEKGIDEIGLFSRAPKGGQYDYTPINDATAIL